MHPEPVAPCFQRLSDIPMGACLVQVTFSPVNQKIETQGQPVQSKHQFHRTTTYVFGRHCFLCICRTDKVKLINNHKSAYKWGFFHLFILCVLWLAWWQTTELCETPGFPAFQGLPSAQALLLLKPSGLIPRFKESL